MKFKIFISILMVITMCSCHNNKRTDGVWDVPFGSTKADIRKLKPNCKILGEGNDYIELQGQTFYNLHVAKALYKFKDNKMVSGCIYITYVYAPPQIARNVFDSITHDMSRKYQLPIRNASGDSIRAQEAPDVSNPVINYWAYQDNNRIMDAKFDTKDGARYMVCIYPYNKIILVKGELKEASKI